jgi:hypothetical protein
VSVPRQESDVIFVLLGRFYLNFYDFSIRVWNYYVVFLPFSFYLYSVVVYLQVKIFM